MNMKTLSVAQRHMLTHAAECGGRLPRVPRFGRAVRTYDSLCALGLMKDGAPSEAGRYLLANYEDRVMSAVEVELDNAWNAEPEDTQRAAVRAHKLTRVMVDALRNMSGPGVGFEPPRTGEALARRGLVKVTRGTAGALRRYELTNLGRSCCADLFGS